MCLVVLDNTLSVVGAGVASLVGRTLEITGFTNPSWFAAALCVHVSNNRAFTIVGAYIVDLISRACQETIIAFEAIITGTFRTHSTLVQFALTMIRAGTQVSAGTGTRNGALFSEESALAFAGGLEGFIHCALPSAMTKLRVFGGTRTQQVALLAEEAFLTDANRLLLVSQCTVSLIAAHFNGPVGFHFEPRARLCTRVSQEPTQACACGWFLWSLAEPHEEPRAQPESSR
jgi:hypothetical protein